MKEWADQVHKRYALMVSGNFVRLARFIGDEETSAFLSDLVSEQGAEDRRLQPKQHPIAALGTAIFEATKAFERLENARALSAAVLSVEDVDLVDRCDAVRQLHWSQLYTCRERHRRIGKVLPLAALYPQQVADWIGVQCAAFKKETGHLLLDRGRATHEQDHHDPFERQWSLMQLHSAVIRMRTGREMDDPGLVDLDLTIANYGHSLVEDLLVEIDAQSADMRELSARFLEKLEPLVKPLYDELSKIPADS